MENACKVCSYYHQYFTLYRIMLSPLIHYTIQHSLLSPSIIYTIQHSLIKFNILCSILLSLQFFIIYSILLLNLILYTMQHSQGSHYCTPQHASGFKMQFMLFIGKQIMKLSSVLEHIQQDFDRKQSDIYYSRNHFLYYC